MGNRAATMGRPKKGTKREPAPQSATDERVAIIHLKGTPEYAAAVDAIHKKTHIPKASLFRLALAEWCERNGHGTLPEI